MKTRTIPALVLMLCWLPISPATAFDPVLPGMVLKVPYTLYGGEIVRNVEVNLDEPIPLEAATVTSGNALVAATLINVSPGTVLVLLVNLTGDGQSGVLTVRLW